jgi:hypothetical protein
MKRKMHSRFWWKTRGKTEKMGQHQTWFPGFKGLTNQPSICFQIIRSVNVLVGLLLGNHAEKCDETGQIYLGGCLCCGRHCTLLRGQRTTRDTILCICNSLSRWKSD